MIKDVNLYIYGSNKNVLGLIKVLSFIGGEQSG